MIIREDEVDYIARRIEEAGAISQDLLAEYSKNDILATNRLFYYCYLIINYGQHVVDYYHSLRT